MMVKKIFWDITDDSKIYGIFFKKTITFSLILLLFLFPSCNERSKPREKNITEPKESVYSNELINETSPYLLQHAKNPVNWRPWNESVFKDASTNDKLVILSIGYSTCHWCHVMEEESFEDLEVAKLMNDNFISIKVDREERPDLDKVYQTALQLVNGTGGWPMNAIILPDGKPVYLGTYQSKEDWMAVLEKFMEEYLRNPEKMAEYASLLAQGVQDYYAPPTDNLEDLVSTEKINEGIQNWSNSWDTDRGGNIGQEKFISPTALNMLLDYSFLQKDDSARNHVFKTLDRALAGGIYDHIGGGFFRYSTDTEWKVPHYEKMLYDNAQMISLLSKAFKITEFDVYKNRAEETFQFLRAQMRNAEGGYYAAMDADTEGSEGMYYLWTKSELQELLGEDFELFSRFYGIEESEKLDNGKFVLFTPFSSDDFAKSEQLGKEEMRKKIGQWKRILLEYRRKRKEPAKDTKIITSWNALLMNSLLEAYKAFGEEIYLNEALSIHDFFVKNNYQGKKLAHSYIGNQGQKQVFLEDYAFFIQGLLGLYEVTLDLKYLNLAKELIASTEEEFGSTSGMYFYNKASDLTPKLMNTIDTEIPSANAVMALNLFKLGHLEYNKAYLKQTKDMAALVMEDFTNHALGNASWGFLLLNESFPYYEVAVVGEDAPKIINEMNRGYLVNTLLAGSTKSSNLALYKDRFFDDGTSIYVCKNNVCRLPVKSVDEAYSLLEGMGHHEIRPFKIKAKF